MLQQLRSLAKVHFNSKKQPCEILVKSLEYISDLVCGQDVNITSLLKELAEQLSQTYTSVTGLYDAQDPYHNH
ncbi:hypothetical protein TNCT_72371 [Trichonephila clavata]|uniref:Uncharacterized protein n=1 Tax=Trichonephila clavata TaxID=2740835 RepID=A0A8X6LIW1_TRICU|nr:hypothetical protein TNCT_72371 [Trichonephila clavata]